MEEFPGNSIKQKISGETSTGETKAASSEENPRQTAGPKPKKTFGSSLRSVFAPDGRSMGDYFIHEVIMPEVKKVAMAAVADTVDGIKQVLAQTAENIKDGISQRFFGDVRPRKSATSYGTGRPVTNYTAAFRKTTTTNVTRREETRPIRRRQSNSVPDGEVLNRAVGEKLLRDLDGKAETTGFASVGDYLEKLGIEPQSTDDDWGWTAADLAEAFVERRRDEFLVCMPEPREIEH